MNFNAENATRKHYRSLLFLLPVLVVVALMLILIPKTNPTLATVPERLKTLETEAADDLLATTADANYEDGVYDGTANGWGGPVSVRVTVEGGKITDITILDASQETASFFSRAKAVIDAVLQQQTWEVDTVSGATYSSRGILNAIQNAITGSTVSSETASGSTSGGSGATGSTASVAFTAPTDGYEDGTYYGSANGWGGSIRVCVVISGGEISKVTVVSASAETPSYLEKAKAVCNRIVSSQSPEVDSVSGATYSSNGIKNATKRALQQAVRTGNDTTADSNLVVEETPVQTSVSENTSPADTSNVVITKVLSGSYRDGVYQGTAEGWGGDITVAVTVKDNTMTNIEVVSSEEETPSYFNKATNVIVAMLTEQTTEVDTISGATYSSNGLIGATKEALKQADVDAVSSADPTVTPPATETSTSSGGTESGQYADGTYTARVLCTDGTSPEDATFYYYLNITVTVENGSIVSISADRMEDQSADPDANEDYLDYALDGRRNYTGVVDQILASQSTDGVDAVSRATYSSRSIIDGVKQAVG